MFNFWCEYRSRPWLEITSDISPTISGWLLVQFSSDEVRCDEWYERSNWRRFVACRRLATEGVFVTRLTSPDLISPGLISSKPSDCELATQFATATTNRLCQNRTIGWRPVFTVSLEKERQNVVLVRKMFSMHSLNWNDQLNTVDSLVKRPRYLNLVRWTSFVKFYKVIQQALVVFLTEIFASAFRLVTTTANRVASQPLSSDEMRSLFWGEVIGEIRLG